jgi:serine/threonine protein kinase
MKNSADKPEELPPDAFFKEMFSHALNTAYGHEGGPLDEILQLDQRYSGEVPLNQGGMKMILQCRDELTDRPIAKAIMQEISSNDAVDDFIAEARLTASLEHPNIVPVHDLGLTPEGEPFFTMKLLSGENLQQILKGLRQQDKIYIENYPLEVLLEIFIKVCDAMAYAHSKNILHLDLKPANIQVDDYGQVLVCDWGLAKRSTCNGKFQGQGKSRLYGTRTDFE